MPASTRPTGTATIQPSGIKPIRFVAAAMAAILIILTGCLQNQPGTPVSTAAPTTPAPTATITPTAAPTQRPVSVEIVPDGGWDFVDLRDPSLPDLLVPGDRGYSLKPDWEIAKIEYSAEAWYLGPGGVALGHEVLVPVKGGFGGGFINVTDKAVDNLKLAVSNLHPAQYFLNSNDHTDDYPSWTVELTGKDGQVILLNATSNSNSAGAPWNVAYNGRIYAQYDGSLGGPVGRMFGNKLSDMMAPTIDRDQQPTALKVSPDGWPSQLIYGFEGLLPLSNSFMYVADLDKSAIRGRIEGVHMIGVSGMLTWGTVTDLTSVRLDTGDGKAAPCPITPKEGQRKDDRLWEFECPVSDAVKGQRYRYRISIDAATGDDAFSTDGNLTGVWGSNPDYVVMPPAEEFGKALDANPDAHDLLTDHILAATNYSFSVPLADPRVGDYTGEAILAGQAKIDGKVMRYSVGTPFELKGGKLSRWGLTRAELIKMLQAAGSYPLTQKKLAEKPDTILNLWYASTDEVSAPRDKPFTRDEKRGSDYYHVYVGVDGICDKNFRALPTRGAPLAAFSFDQNWDYNTFSPPSFIIVNGSAQINELEWTDYGTTGTFSGGADLPIPDFLKEISAHEVFDLTLSNTREGDAIFMFASDDATSTDIDALASMVEDAVPTAYIGKAPKALHVTGVAFTLDADGKVVPQACPASDTDQTPTPTQAGH